MVICHTADRVWSTGSFNVTTNVFLERNLGPIKDNTIIGIDRNTGKQVYAFGKGLFYLPHGITVDGEDVWVTDVGLHQVMKLNRIKSGDNPLMVLGTKFMPGKSRKSFCKPTSVAILPNGDFFVADGYCNARIMKFNSKGEFILLWGQDSFQGILKNKFVQKQVYFNQLSHFRKSGLRCPAQLFGHTACSHSSIRQRTGMCGGPGKRASAMLSAF